MKLNLSQAKDLADFQEVQAKIKVKTLALGFFCEEQIVG